MSQTEFDKLQTMPDGSLIQHGLHNNRIYLIKLSGQANRELPQQLIDLAKKQGYTKIFAKLPEKSAKNFITKGFNIEASVPNFYNGSDKGLFLAYYLDIARSQERHSQEHEKYIELAKHKSNTSFQAIDKNKFVLRECNEKDITNIAKLYRQVFLSYPFPIFNSEYILKTMRSNVTYFGIENKGEIIALASAEKDESASNVEMTDFATLPEWRGQGLGANLLKYMETEMKKQTLQTAYTIARSASPGMNITFAKLGYTFAGRLKNNTNISGTIESMNVWYKALL